jgi:hypothetical protein
MTDLKCAAWPYDQKFAKEAVVRREDHTTLLHNCLYVPLSVEHALSLGYSRGANCERVASALGGPLSMDIDHAAVLVVGRECLSSNCGEITETLL